MAAAFRYAIRNHAPVKRPVSVPAFQFDTTGFSGTPRPSTPLGDADRCVMCGMCLPHCPTFALTGNEGDSPRGRLMLMRGLEMGRLDIDERMTAHIDGCLSCRACEAMCPSRVPYGRLSDAMRDRLHPEADDDSLAERVRVRLLESAALRRLAARLLRLAQTSGLVRLVHRVGNGFVRRALDMLPPIEPPVRWKPRHEAKGERRGVVGLFTGCTAEGLDTTTVRSAIDLLTVLGYEVRVPQAQVCCGAMHRHDARPATAERFMRANLDAFTDPEIGAVVGCASGCSAQLKEYGDADFTAKAADLCGQLDRILADDLPEGVSFAPLQARVAVHVPCTQRNVLREGDVTRRLLRHIPQVKALELPGNHLCCGAAGTYILSHPEQADALVAPKIAALAELRPDILVSANVGCALHFKAALRRGGLNIEVVHPVTLLARQIRFQA